MQTNISHATTYQSWYVVTHARMSDVHVDETIDREERNTLR